MKALTWKRSAIRGRERSTFSYRPQEAFDQPPEALAVTFQAPRAGRICTGWAEVFPCRRLARCDAKGRPEMGVKEDGRGEENGRKSIHWSRKTHLVKTSDHSKTEESGGQLLRSKGVSWSHSSDKKQESTYSYLRARQAERKLVRVPTALCLHGAQIWVSQHLCVTLTPWSQLLTDKVVPSVLLCSGETWPCSPKVSLHVSGQPFISPASYFMIYL